MPLCPRDSPRRWRYRQRVVEAAAAGKECDDEAGDAFGQRKGLPRTGTGDDRRNGCLAPCRSLLRGIAAPLPRDSIPLRLSALFRGKGSRLGRRRPQRNGSAGRDLVQKRELPAIRRAKIHALFLITSGFAVPNTHSRVMRTSLIPSLEGISYMTSVIRFSMMVRSPRAPVFKRMAVLAISLTAASSKAS